MAAAFFFASSTIPGSVPDQRTRHLPDASQKASPNRMPGTAATSASWMDAAGPRPDPCLVGEDPAPTVPDGLDDFFAPGVPAADQPAIGQPGTGSQDALPGAGTMEQDRGSVRHEQASLGITLATKKVGRRPFTAPPLRSTGAVSRLPLRLSPETGRGLRGPILFRTRLVYEYHRGSALLMVGVRRHVRIGHDGCPISLETPALVRSRRVFRPTSERREARKVPTVEGEPSWTSLARTRCRARRPARRRWAGLTSSTAC